MFCNSYKVYLFYWNSYFFVIHMNKIKVHFVCYSLIFPLWTNGGMVFCMYLHKYSVVCELHSIKKSVDQYFLYLSLRNADQYFLYLSLWNEITKKTVLHNWEYYTRFFKKELKNMYKQREILKSTILKFFRSIKEVCLSSGKTERCSCLK